MLSKYPVQLVPRGRVPCGAQVPPAQSVPLRRVAADTSLHTVDTPNVNKEAGDVFIAFCSERRKQKKNSINKKKMSTSEHFYSCLVGDPELGQVLDSFTRPVRLARPMLIGPRYRYYWRLQLPGAEHNGAHDREHGKPENRKTGKTPFAMTADTCFRMFLALAATAYKTGCFFKLCLAVFACRTSMGPCCSTWPVADKSDQGTCLREHVQGPCTYREMAAKTRSNHTALGTGLASPEYPGVPRSTQYEHCWRTKEGRRRPASRGVGQCLFLACLFLALVCFRQFLRWYFLLVFLHKSPYIV